MFELVINLKTTKALVFDLAGDETDDTSTSSLRILSPSNKLVSGSPTASPTDVRSVGRQSCPFHPLPPQGAAKGERFKLTNPRS